MSRTPASRRKFLKAAAGTFALPYFVPSTAFGANERITTAHIGVGGQGRGNLKGFLGKKTPAVVCDVDQRHLKKAVELAKAAGIEVDAVEDYRSILDRRDIDAVVISTPDHWHAIPTIEACQAGKDVYCEKPLSLTIAEGRQMVTAARQHGRIVQTGSQQRSSSEFRTACELVRSGRIGELQTVLVGIPGPNHPGEPVPDSESPAELNYDFWLGPAPERPYNRKRVHYNFRFFRDYSGGQLTNWGAHHLDIAQWGMGTDDTGPISVEGTATFHPKGWHEVTETCRATFGYANGVTLVVGQGQPDIPKGTTFIGTNGQIHVDRGRLSGNPVELLENPNDTNGVKLYESRDHKQNFLDCMRSRELPICDVEIGHRSATICHLTNIVVGLDEKLTWNPAQETFVDNDAANALLSRTNREPYSVKS